MTTFDDKKLISEDEPLRRQSSVFQQIYMNIEKKVNDDEPIHGKSLYNETDYKKARVRL